MKFGILLFPGSNCDHDAYHVAAHVLGQDARFIWHKDTRVGDVDIVIVPGGFSYGDYLRAGAIARFSPIMKDVVRFANDGGLVMGICNGFQILTEAGLLPGALLRNRDLNFVCRTVTVRVCNTASRFTSGLKKDQYLDFPVAHHDGNYFADAQTLDTLEQSGRIAFRYVDNPNGSARDIAGILNEAGNVLGLMPHPERVISPLLGGTDGLTFFRQIVGSV